MPSEHAVSLDVENTILKKLISSKYEETFPYKSIGHCFRILECTQPKLDI